MPGTMQTLKGDGASMMLSLEEEAIGHNEKLSQPFQRVLRLSQVLDIHKGRSVLAALAEGTFSLL